MSEDIVLYAILAAIGFGVWVTDSFPFSSEYTAYPISCEEQQKKTVCKNLDKLNYKVFEDTQKVVMWLDRGFPLPLTDCVVRDKKNWACFRSSTQGTVVIDATLQTHPKEEGVFYIAKWRWWGIKLGIIKS